jgi:hypothetical protein
LESKYSSAGTAFRVGRHAYSETSPAARNGNPKARIIKPPITLSILFLSLLDFHRADELGERLEFLVISDAR